MQHSAEIATLHSTHSFYNRILINLRLPRVLHFTVWSVDLCYYFNFAGSDDPGSRISIVTNEDGELQLLLLVTSDMKELYRKFPEVLFIDGTYSVNKLRFPLYTVLVEDGNGNGRVVGYCFVSDESKKLWSRC